MNIGFKVLVTAMVVAFGLAFALPVSADPPGLPFPGVSDVCSKHVVKLRNPNCS
jgi:hypothetical protein